MNPEILHTERPRLLAVICALTYFFSYFSRLSLATVLVDIVNEGELPKGGLSVALTALFISYGIGQLFSGFLGDRISPQYLISGGLITSALMNIIVSFSGDVRVFIVAWTINGIGQAMIWPPLVKIMDAHFKGKMYRRVAFGVSCGSSLGNVAVFLIAALCVYVSGWRFLFRLSGFLTASMGVFGLLVYNRIGCRTIIKDLKNSKAQTDIKGKNNVKMPRADVLCFSVLMLSIIMLGILRDGISTWLPSILSEEFKVGSVVSILCGVVLPLFTIVCYKLVDILYKKRIHNEIVCSALMFFIGLVSSVLLYLFEGESFSLTLALLMIINGCMHGASLLLTSLILPKLNRGSNISFLSGFINACVYIGSGASAYGIAKISDVFGWSAVIIVWCAAALIGGICCITSKRLARG